MKKRSIVLLLLAFVAIATISFKDDAGKSAYVSAYNARLKTFRKAETILISSIEGADFDNPQHMLNLKVQLHRARMGMKAADFWLRYLDPLQYKKINSPLPVEWETEVFEKFEKPYRRDGAGFTLAELYFDEGNINRDTLKQLVVDAMGASMSYHADSVTDVLKTYHHFYLCNRLYLLNLAAIYTTGFDCPDPEQVIPELREMMGSVKEIYTAYNESFPANALTSDYLALYDKAIDFVNAQPDDYKAFDHYTFIRTYVNPLFGLNRNLIKQYHVVTSSNVDYSLRNDASSIFDKNLYYGQNVKGIFLRVKDEATLAEIDSLGKQLFYDPLLSANNMRSCASCHKPTEYFTDTLLRTAFQMNHKDGLPRNSPTLINAQYNHLVMLDGKHTSLQDQVKAVIANSIEMGSSEAEVVKKVMSCKAYKTTLKKLLKLTPQEKEVTIDHIAGALTFYYSKYSKYYAPFDDAMNNKADLSADAKHGFNLFMGKAQCGTCHFVPQFNGVKPPFVGSEFEVLGVPADTAYTRLSADIGRHDVHAATETMNAFRTGTVRNSAHTAPYMHNGVFNTMQQVIDFYDGGGGAGHGLKVDNQTLSSDSLHLTTIEKTQLVAFIQSLNENIVFEKAPGKLPASKNKSWNQRVVGGVY
jgi:cytochrome c peroxidase